MSDKKMGHQVVQCVLASACMFFVFVFVSPVRWAGLSAFENQDDVIGRLLQLFPRLLAVSQRVDELLVRIFVIRNCEGVWLLSLFS